MDLQGDNRMSYENITELLRRGREKQQTEHARKETEKLGTLRVGNSGIRDPKSGDVAGSCHRKAYLRMQGIEIETPDDAKQMMFQMGYASEDITTSTLEGMLEPGHTILREADIPIDWTTRSGIRVTGRPDVVICSGAKPLLGIELKSVHSVWSAKKYLFEQTPSLSNLCQAGHYMWKLGIPYRLIYKGYSQLGQGMSWAPRMASMFPAQGSPMSEYMDYNERGLPLQVKQFELGYSLEIDEKSGRLRYRSDLPNSSWVDSLITTGDIQEFYEHVAEIGTSRDLGSRPLTLDASGNKESYTMCKYCPIQAECDTYDGDRDFDKWLNSVREVSSK